MPGFIGVPGLLVIGLVVLLFFGPKRLPEMGRSMGRGFREFKDSITGPAKDEVEGEPAQTPVPPHASGTRRPESRPSALTRSR